MISMPFRDSKDFRCESPWTHGMLGILAGKICKNQQWTIAKKRYWMWQRSHHPGFIVKPSGCSADVIFIGFWFWGWDWLHLTWHHKEFQISLEPFFLWGHFSRRLPRWTIYPTSFIWLTLSGELSFRRFAFPQSRAHRRAIDLAGDHLLSKNQDSLDTARFFIMSHKIMPNSISSNNIPSNNQRSHDS